MPEPLVDRQFLERLERLTLYWQKSFNGLVGGHNLSRFAGPGQEFLDHRNFHSGDDLRAVNWRAYLRFEKLFLKMFQIEPRVPVRLLLDTIDAAVVVPVIALRHGPSGDFVYVVNADRTVSLRNVTAGIAGVNDVEITKGLAVGEEVVTEGGDRLKDGARIQTSADLAANAPQPGQRSAQQKGTRGGRGGNHREANGAPTAANGTPPGGGSNPGISATPPSGTVTGPATPTNK